LSVLTVALLLFAALALALVLSAIGAWRNRRRLGSLVGFLAAGLFLALAALCGTIAGGIRGYCAAHPGGLRGTHPRRAARSAAVSRDGGARGQQPPHVRSGGRCRVCRRARAQMAAARQSVGPAHRL